MTAISSEASVAINNRGEVAYRARAYTTTILNAVSALYVNQTRLFQQGDVIDGQRIAVFTEPIAINDAGTVLFNASIDLFDATTHIFSQSQFVAESGLMFDGFTARNFFLPKINNAGDVAFLGHLQELFPGQDLAVLSPDGIILKPGDSIENLTVESIRTLSGITDDGDVLMSMSSTVADGERVLFIGTQDRILFRTGDIVAGIEVPHFVGPPVLNNQGQLAFLRSVPAPGRIGYMPDRQGILFVDGEVVISEGTSWTARSFANCTPCST